MPPIPSDSSCPKQADLRRYLDGEGTTDELGLLDAHLARCEECQNHLRALDQPGDLMSPLISEAVQSRPIDMPSALELALQRIRMEPLSAGARGSRSSLEYEELVQIRDYRILESIGEGGMGHVYRAVHMRLNRPVAIKVLRHDRVNSSEAIARFAREMQVIAKLEHPHIVRALDAGEQDGLHYLVMEFLAGFDVGRLLLRLGPLPVSDACQITKLAASALQFAHDRKVLHRDVKPSNILLTADGGVKILDLGLAQFSEFNTEPSLSSVGQALGTLAYMAPEQITRREEITTRADVFSLGVTLHEILTGQRPFARFGAAPMLADLSLTRPDVSPELQELIGQMVSSDSKQRPASMQEVIDRIEPYTQSADLPSLVREYYRWKRPSTGSAAGVSSQTPASHSDRETQEETMTSAPTAPMRAINSKALGDTKATWSWVFGAASSLVALGLGAWIALDKFLLPVVYGKIEPIPDPISLPPTTGDLDVSPVGGVAEQLLRNGEVFLVNNETDEKSSLHAGINAIAPGSYTIAFDAPEDIEVLDGIQVAKGGVRKVQLTTSLSKPFQFPSIPSSVGSFAAYHGTLWHVGWPAGKELPFDIRMQNIGSEQGQDGANLTWLKIETTIHHSLGDFSETGFVLVNADRWKSENRMDVVEGYVRASGPAIARLVRDSQPPSRAMQQKDRSEDLVVRFDQNRDVLRDFAASVLPEQRLSLQDFITLFFGDDQMAAAAEPIRKLRAELSKTGPRNAWIQSVQNSRGEVPCYVVSSRNRDESPESAGYFMARRKSEPYSFVRMEAKTPGIRALCVITGSGVGTVDVTEIARIKSRVRDVPHPGEFKRYWNRASIPDESATTTWHGVIALGAKSRQMVQMTVSTLGCESIDHVACRWLEIEVSSSLDQGEDAHYEAARLLVDDDQYRRLGVLDIKRGWIAYGDKKTVFAFPTERELNELLHQRMILLEDPKLQRFGVIDVLSMLFDRDFSPQSPFSVLRKAAFEERAGVSPKCTPTELVLGGAPPIPAEEWTSPEQSAMQYKIRKAAQIPFNLVDVVFEQKPMVKIALEIENHAWLGESASPRILGSEQMLAMLQAETERRIEKARKSNWRVWSWRHEGRTYKAFAEYGGTTDWSAAINDRSNVVVLLRNRRGDEIRVPSSSLFDEDWAWARNGRTWYSSSPAHRDKQYLMVEDNGKTIALQMRDVTTEPHRKPLKELDPRDQEWVLALREALKVKEDPATRTASWMKFAPYIR